MMYTTEDAKQFKKELKTLIHAERIHPRVMNVALKAVYGEIHNGTQTVSKSATGTFSDDSGNNQNKKARKYHMSHSPYEKNELETMFLHLSPERLPNWKPYKLFIPALALYNGLRMSEACQLQFENVVQLDGIPCIRVEDNEEIGATVKKLSCIRTVPIHPLILQLGFLKFIGKIKNGPLWPELTPDEPRKGYSSRFVKFFSFFNREFVAKGSTKSFYSLRLNFVNAIRDNAPEAIACQLIGMSPKTVTLGRYGLLEQPGPMLEYLRKLDYGFDIFSQTGIEQQSECEVAEQVEHFFERPF